MKRIFLTQTAQSSIPLVLSIFVIGGIVATGISLSNVAHAIRQHKTAWQAGAGFLGSEKAAWASFSQNDTSGCGMNQPGPSSANGSQMSNTSGVCFKRPIAEGYYTLSPKNSGLCMEVQYNSTRATASILQDTCTQTQTGQLWQIVKVGIGFQIVSTNSGYCLDVQGASTSDGASLQQYPCLGPSATNQIFDFAPVSDGSWQIKPVHTSGHSCLTVTGGNTMTSPGVYIDQSTCGPGVAASQDWVLAPATVAPSVNASGFESPVLASRTFQSSPASGGWTFGGSAGITTNASIWGNPVAPEGTQVGYLQSLASIEQLVHFPTTGTFTVSANIAPRPGYPSNPIRILIDGIEVGYFTPTASSFVPVTSNAFTVASGLHSVIFSSLNNSDSTTFIDSVSIGIQPLNTQQLSLQGEAAITRKIIFPQAGAFYVSLQAKNATTLRPGGTFTISLNNQVEGTVNVNSANFVTSMSNSFGTVPGVCILKLQGAGGSGAAALIDSLQVLPSFDTPQAHTGWVMAPIAQSTEAISGWSVNNVVDGIPSTVYSSNYFSTSTNDRGAWVAAWLPSGQNVSQVQLTARQPGNQAFPLAYNIYLTSPDNSQWVYMGNFNNQPNASGVAVVALGKTYSTWGVVIQPSVLGVDDNGSHYFQLAEVKLAP